MTNNKDVMKQVVNLACPTIRTHKKCSYGRRSQFDVFLKNQLYIGILQQGKTRKINYKLAQRCKVPPEEWISTDKAVPPIIEESLFWKCQSR